MRLMGSGSGRDRGAANRAGVDEDGALRLALDDREGAVPWLEGERDEDEAEIDTGRLALFVATLLLFLALLAGAGWWLWQNSAEEELLADGSVIAAPPGPYKVRPGHPGGREVAGTGATSFEVGEGQRVEGRIASRQEPVASPAVPDGAVVQGAALQAGVGVQIGAYPTRKEAEAAWQQLHTRLEPLHGRPHRVLEGRADSGIVHRLQVVAPDLASARALCATLRDAGGDCQVKR